MSQRKEKYARELGRRVTDVEKRLDQLATVGVDLSNDEAFWADDAFEEHLLRARYTAECKEHARDKAHADRRMRRILEAEEAARSWKAVAYGALVTAIIVLIIAVAAVHAKATEPVPQESAPANELAILPPETLTHSKDDAKNTPVFVTNLTQINDSDKVDAKIYNVPLDADLQQLLQEACEEFGVDMATMIALIDRETDFSNVYGDGGDSIGYCQVQPQWWGELMKEIGATDLTDPLDNFRTSCAILAKLMDEHGTLENALTAYNTGKPGTSEYSREILFCADSLKSGHV